MINGISLKFGKAPTLAPIVFNPVGITVFVGPNNSGKSKVLREIQNFCETGQSNPSDVILGNLTFQGLSAADVESKISMVRVKPNPGEAEQDGHIFVGKKGTRHHLNKENLSSVLQNPASNLKQFCRWYLAYNTLMLDGQGRMNLINDQSAGNLQTAPSSSLQYLFRSDEKRAELRRSIFDAFGKYFVLDPTSLGSFSIKFSDVAPSSPIEERGIHQEAVDFHSRATHISLASDGVKAFTGILTEIVAGDPSVLLIDEPEAFLHPALAYKLGREISKASMESHKRVFVSTHSPSFVMGCIQSGVPVNIIRLTYRDGIGTARILENDDILRIMRNPLLRSTNVLSGLFYECVIVAESDADRAFYQEINERLLRFSPERGIPNCLFLNAQNKQTVQVIIAPLRELGIPAAGIVDIDILKDGGSVFTSFLKSGSIPEIMHQPLSHIRSTLKERFNQTGKEMKRDGGVELLSEEDRAGANDLFNQLEAYGLFVVRCGELESWLRALGAHSHGPAWLIDIFEKMGEDPESVTYVKPTHGDVWDFMGQLKRWLENPLRSGIPG